MMLFINASMSVIIASLYFSSNAQDQ